MNTSFNFKRVLLLGLSSIFFSPKNLHSIYDMFAEALCATVGRELDVEGFAGDVLVLGDGFKMVPVSTINKYSYLARYDEYHSESVTDVKKTFTTKVIKLVVKVKDYFETLIVGADQEFLVWDSSYKTSDLLDNSTNASSSYVKAKDLKLNNCFVTSFKTACCLYSWSEKTDDTYEMYRIYSGKKSLKYIEVGKSLLRAKLPQLPDPGYGKYCSNIQIPLLSFSFGGAAMAFTAVTPLTFGLNIATSILTNVVAYQINLSQNDADTLRKVTTKQIHSSFGAEFEFSGDLNYCQQEQLKQREIEKREEEQKIIDKALAEKAQQKEKPKDLPIDLKESLLKNLADQKIDFAQISGFIIGQDFYKTKVLFKNQFNELESHSFKTDEDSLDKNLPKKDCCVTVSTSTKGPEIDIEYLPADKSQSVLTMVMFDSFRVKETVHNYQPIPMKINPNPAEQDECRPKNKLKKDATILNAIAFYLNQYFFKNDFFDCSEFVEQETAEELKIRLNEIRQREEERIAEHNRVERLRDEALEKAREQLRFDIKKKKEAEEKLKKLDQEKKDEAEKLKKLNEEKKEQEKEKQESCFFAELKNLSITSCSIAAFATLKTCFKFLKSRKLFSAATLFAIKKVPKLAGAIIVLEQLWPYLTDGYDIAKDYKDFSEVGEFYLKRTSHEKSSDDVFDKLDEFSKKYFTEQQKLELTLEKIMSKNDTSTEDLVDQLTIAFQEFTESTSEKILIKIDQSKDEVISEVVSQGVATREEVIILNQDIANLKSEIEKSNSEQYNYFKNMFEAGAAKAEQSAVETSKLIAIIYEKDSSAREKDNDLRIERELSRSKDKMLEVERESSRSKDKMLEVERAAKEQERAAKEQERAAKEQERAAKDLANAKAEKLEKYLRSIGVDPDTI